MRKPPPYELRPALDQRRIEESLHLPAQFRFVVGPHSLHIPHCKTIAIRAIAWLAESGGPNVVRFPLIATRAPATYSDATKGRHLRWRRPGSKAAQVVALPVLLQRAA